MSQVSVERLGRVAVVRLERPERHNALDREMLGSLARAVDEVEAALPRAVVVTGAGDAFCVGLDLDPSSNPTVVELLHAVQTHDRGGVESLLRDTRRVVDRLVGLPVPVVAAVNGAAWGAGAEIALRCDLRVLDAAATLGLVGVRSGLSPTLGGGPALVRLVGPARAADLVLSARKVSAMEAYGIGLANRLAEPGQALEMALQLAGAIAANGPWAVRAALRVLRAAPGLGPEDALELERQAAVDVILAGEFLVGMRAVLARSEPDFPDVP
jgi:enoyl-CoA hydratase/carnithine racemase